VRCWRGDETTGRSELVTDTLMRKRMGRPGEAYEAGRAGQYGRIAQTATGSVLIAAPFAGRSCIASAAAGAALLPGSAATRLASSGPASIRPRIPSAPAFPAPASY
jgi:hypothetical protein